MPTGHGVGVGRRQGGCGEHMPLVLVRNPRVSIMWYHGGVPFLSGPAQTQKTNAALWSGLWTPTVGMTETDVVYRMVARRGLRRGASIVACAPGVPHWDEP